MTTGKTEKELAFLHDLYVATDWGERFAGLIDEHVGLPKKGRVLYVGSGTGGHALALKARAGGDVEFVCVDESEERLTLARAKSAATPPASDTVFSHEQLDDTLTARRDVRWSSATRRCWRPSACRVLAEMARVAAPGGWRSASDVASASSFGEFFSVYGRL